jgi:hypothetical protein
MILGRVRALRTIVDQARERRSAQRAVYRDSDQSGRVVDILQLR